MRWKRLAGRLIVGAAAWMVLGAVWLWASESPASSCQLSLGALALLIASVLVGIVGPVGLIYSLVSLRGQGGMWRGVSALLHGGLMLGSVWWWRGEFRGQGEESSETRRGEFHASGPDAAPPSTPRIREEGLPCPNHAGDSVELLGINHCAVPRQVFFGSPDCPKSCLRPESVRIAGGQRGFLFRGIRPQSIYAKCGFRNGDVWLKVNDLPLISLDDALVEYARLRQASSLDVALVRKGRGMNIRVDLRSVGNTGGRILAHWSSCPDKKARSARSCPHLVRCSQACGARAGGWLCSSYSQAL
jgi:hypothetical protein